ncbi:hypothetical protein [Alkalicoccobacillus porphyridii]|uniref:hypothetical protein n=1 Tax=Alkalicoccobacillus porphyridii TaxID=2597270 RepID=UPI00163D5D41|nr:hypothetical protein [Alkalicoccobacillus porphyridii]
MIHRLERELFQRELEFLKMLQGKATKEDSPFSAAIEEEIHHLEQVLEETETAKS